MSKLSTHMPFIGKKFSISIDELEPGMIVDFGYQKDSVGAPENKKYTVMIVDPSFKRPQDKENFTHALNLDVASRASILEIAKTTGSTLANSNLLARKVNAEKLIVEGQPRQFYQQSISKLLTGGGKGSYRTFKTSRLKGIHLIDYTFPQEVVYISPTEHPEE